MRFETQGLKSLICGSWICIQEKNSIFGMHYLYSVLYFYDNNVQDESHVVCFLCCVVFFPLSPLLFNSSTLNGSVCLLLGLILFCMLLQCRSQFIMTSWKLMHLHKTDWGNKQFLPYKYTKITLVWHFKFMRTGTLYMEHFCF